MESRGRSYGSLLAPAFIAAVALLGCVHRHSTPEWLCREAAVRYARTNLDLKEVRVGHVVALDGHFAVWVLELPETPGGFVIIDVSRTGEILGVRPGK
jgi:hypothetical protein